ncbi:hypothetical protein TWF696_007075 [Orbilia brochopaga]|uniref:Cytochrome b561 domain-containing protein n=1 Tax=Orbilia brochopaga TaxID=3140254 RepID=A0AAV9UUE0_9PEZI
MSETHATQENSQDAIPTLEETAPLIGSPGAIRQHEDAPFWRNLFMGTGSLAQLGLLVLTAVIWTSVLSLKITLFSLHPILNSVAVVSLVEAVLLLQPTNTPYQKRTGAIIHSILIVISIVAFVGALTAIVLNKIRIKHTHFDSPHSILGLATYIAVVIQATVGLAQFYTPGVFGSIERAKSIYKYHRIAGYIIHLLLFATLLAATKTDFALGPLRLKTWKIALGIFFIVVGVFPRVRKEKLGFKRQ